MKIDCDFRVKAFRPRKIILNVETEEDKKVLLTLMRYLLYNYPIKTVGKIPQTIKKYLEED